MYGLIKEQGSFGANPGMKDIARHLYTRMFSAPVVIVVEDPAVALSQLRKHWFRLYRRADREKSSTLDVVRVNAYIRLLTRMLTMRFTTKWPDDEPAQVYIVTVEQLLQWAPECRTLYVTCDISREHLHLITALMPRGALVVIA